MTPMTATRTPPCRTLPTILPNVLVRATGMTRSRKISKKLLSALGFSNGWAEFALKIPPPFVPSSLMASWDAAGAIGIVFCAPSTPVTSMPERSDITTPIPTRMIAATNDSGSMIRTMPRVRSTQKFPMRSVPARTNPRVSAIATAMPTAADTTFCTVRPAICTVWPSTCSGT